jgi:hypothetical protein
MNLILNRTLVILMCVTCFACQNSPKRDGNLNQAAISETQDPRTKDELSFLNRVKKESDDDFTTDAIKKDSHIEAFNKYAADSLKKIANWEMIVTGIDDYGAH